MKDVRADEGGVSTVVAMLMLLGILIGVFAMYMSISVPQEFAAKEKEHMLKVRDGFVDIQGAIQDLRISEISAENQRSITIPMSANLASGIFRGPNIAGRLRAEASAGDNGKITFDIQNPYYVPQTYVYEDGAVILVQDNRSSMVSEPPLVAFRNREGENIEVALQTTRITENDEITTTGTATITITAESITTSSPENRENVTIVVYSTYRDAWKDYLKKLAKEMRDENIDAAADLENLRLTIYGKRLTGVNDIYYIESYREIGVTIW